MNKKAQSNGWLFGFFLVLIGFAIIGFSWFHCINGGAPYDMDKVNSCLFGLKNLSTTGIGFLIALIGSILTYNSNR